MALFVALAAVSLLATAAAVVAWMLRAPWRARAARASRGLGLLFLAFGLVGAVAGAVHTFGALQALGLSQADRQRVLSNGIAEGMYNLAFALVLGLPPLVAGRLGRRATPP